MSTRIALERLPGTARLLLGGLFKRRRRLDPEQRLSAPLLRLDGFMLPTAALQDFAAFHGVPGRRLLSQWYPLLQPLHLVLLNRPELPLRAAGLVHAGNRIELGRWPAPDEPLAIDVALRGDTLRRRGRILHFETRVHAGEALLVRMHSDYFLRERPRQLPQAEQAVEPAQPLIAQDPVELHFDAGYGRRYARLSGDWNPIHLWRWSARLFGFKQPIAHGAAVVAAIEAACLYRDRRELCGIETRFLRPLPLPGRAWLHRVGADYALAGVDGEALQRGRFVFGEPSAETAGGALSASAG